jgi:hypothetical protein
MYCVYCAVRLLTNCYFTKTLTHAFITLIFFGLFVNPLQKLFLVFASKHPIQQIPPSTRDGRHTDTCIESPVITDPTKTPSPVTRLCVRERTCPKISIAFCSVRSSLSSLFENYCRGLSSSSYYHHRWFLIESCSKLYQSRSINHGDWWHKLVERVL